MTLLLITIVPIPCGRERGLRVKSVAGHAEKGAPNLGPRSQVSCRGHDRDGGAESAHWLAELCSF